MNTFKVTRKAMRPASCLKQCFYCQQHIGEVHKKDCVLIKKKVKVTMNVEMEIEIDEPAGWDASQIEFHLNESSWCVDNVLEDLEKMIKEEGCLCRKAHFTNVEDISEPYLEED